MRRPTGSTAGRTSSSGPMPSVLTLTSGVNDTPGIKSAEAGIAAPVASTATIANPHAPLIVISPPMFPLRKISGRTIGDGTRAVN